MKKNIFAALFLLAVFVYSCTVKEESLLENPASSISDMALVDDGSIVDEPIVLVEGFIPDKEDFPDTKTALTITEGSGGGAKFTFVDGDRLGIFAYSPAGVQMPFELKSSEASSAVFNCPGFSLRSGTAYAAYYPYNSSASSHSSIPVNYTGQWQPSAAAPASSTSANFNISSADYLMAQATPSGNACSFKMSHIGALVVMDVTVSQSLTYTEVSLNSSSSSFIQTGTLNLAQDYTLGTNSNPTQGIAISSSSTAQKMTLKLGSSTGSGINLTEGQTYRFCMMVPPTNVTGTVTIRLKDNSNVEHIAYVGTKNLRQGYAYKYTCTVDATTSLYDLYGATANCYIVNTNSIDSDGYFFPTHIAGNGRAVSWSSIGFVGDGTGTYAYPYGGGYSLSGNGVAVTLNQNSCVSDVFFANNRIYFKASGAKGNAKLTLTYNGDKVWTWHIWCTDAPGTATVNGYTVMDRNMGAITKGVEYLSSEEMTGFFYPFGYPFGFTVSEYSNGNTDGYRMYDAFALSPNRPMLRRSNSEYWPFNVYAASSPTRVWELIWGNGGNKTMYDPCPPGYKVTPSAFWNGISTTADYYGLIINGIRFPVNGVVWQGGWLSMNINLGGTNYSNQATYNHRIYMWTSANVASQHKAYFYHINKYYGDGSQMANGGVTYDNNLPDGGRLTYGMGVRCVVGW